jgi:hypothetical protein
MWRRVPRILETTTLEEAVIGIRVTAITTTLVEVDGAVETAIQAAEVAVTDR